MAGLVSGIRLLRNTNALRLLSAPPISSPVIPGRAKRGPGIHNHSLQLDIRGDRPVPGFAQPLRTGTGWADLHRAVVVMDSGLDALRRPGMTEDGRRATSGE